MGSSKKPVKVATVKYAGDNLNEIIDFVGEENVVGIHLQSIVYQYFEDK